MKLEKLDTSSGILTRNGSYWKRSEGWRRQGRRLNIKRGGAESEMGGANKRGGDNSRETEGQMPF